MEILYFLYFIFIVIAIFFKAATAEEKREKPDSLLNKETREKLLTDLKEAFQDLDAPTPPAKTPEELMNESSWEKLTASMDEFPDPDDLFSPVGAVARLFDLGRDGDTDDDEDEDEFELTVGGSTFQVEVPPADAGDGRDGESHYFSADETGEGHVASVGLSREKQLEQLETWREAGLIDEDEYKERKRKIKRG